ncbi:MAG: YlbF family regulator [Ruminococcaceae bacterium]|nr:YlbF family regulator [Oscillospiraceae bacterium]
MDYVEAATRLGEAIAESKQFTEWRDSEKAVLADEKSQTLMKEFRDLQTEMVKISGKEDVTQADLEAARDALLAKQNELTDYEVTQKYFEARQNFEVMMKTVNEIIQFNIDGQLNGSSCGGDCSSCGGCH